MKAKILEHGNCELIGSRELEAIETAVPDGTPLVAHIEKSAEALGWDGLVEMDDLEDDLASEAKEKEEALR